MAEKNIEMNVMNESGGYDVLYPKNISDITLNSEHLKDLFNLNENSNVDDAFDYVSKKIILLQYHKAGVNVTLKSQAGTPIPNIPILGITANYDGSGNCVTDENGSCFGYCDVGNVNIHCNTYVDMTINNQQLETVATEMYDVNLIGSNFINFKKWNSTPGNVMFSTNVSRLDVSVGGGGGGGYQLKKRSVFGYPGGGGGGYSVIQENFPFTSDTNYSVVVGTGAPSQEYTYGEATKGGTSSFGTLVAKGGVSALSHEIGTGNGNGGEGGNDNQVYNDQNGKPGTNGTTYIYTSFSEQSLYGGGGGGGAFANYNSLDQDDTFTGGKGGLPGGGDGGSIAWMEITKTPLNGVDGLGGGGGGCGGSYSYNDDAGEYSVAGKGGNGCVAIRIYLKITA